MLTEKIHNEQMTSDSMSQTSKVEESAPRIINPPITFPTEISPDIIENNLKTEIYNRARLTKFLSIIDIFFQLISLVIAISQKTNIVYFFIFFPLCICGYIGAKKYKKNYILAYVCYLLFMSLICFAITIFTGSLWYIIFLGIELYLFIYVWKLYSKLNKISEEGKNSLKQGWFPDRMVILYY